VATKKQLRRREKLRRHEYEEVYVDDEGNVVEPPDELEPAAGKPARNGKGEPSRRPSGRTGRTVQPPSWRRVGKRALLFAPLLFLAFTILPGNEDLTVLERIVVTLPYVLLLIPFMYLMDRMTYRIWLKRSGRADAGGGKRS
jgi:hypothetical protein